MDSRRYQSVVVCDDGLICSAPVDIGVVIRTEIKSLLDKSESSLSVDRLKMAKRQVMKNLLVISVCLMTLFTSLQGLANLQSTMNGEGGLGLDSLAVIYAASMLSSIFLPTLMIKKIGCKSTVALTMLSTVPYVVANFYPKWQTLVTSAVIMGIAMGPLSTSVCFYVGQIAYRFKNYDEDSLESITSRFFGIYSFFSENTQIWGNLISYFVLKPDMAPLHVASNISDDCGVDFREPQHFINYTNPNLEPPTNEKRYILVGLYLGFAVLAVILLNAFLDPLKNDKDEYRLQEEEERTTCCTPLMAAIKHLRNPNQILLLPITIYCGMEIAFYTGDVTKAYIACSWGVHHVGFVTICFGFMGATMALLVGPLVKHLGLTSVSLGAAVINVILCCFLFNWNPNPKHPMVFYVVAGAWGMTDAIWWSQIPALYGLLFKEDPEASFSNFFFWSFLGYFLAYFFSNYLAMQVKINVLLAFLVFGGICCLAVQIRMWKSRRHYITIEDS